MKPIKLKTSKETNIGSKLLEFVSNNYGRDSITQNLQKYFSDFEQNRNIISYNKDDQESIKDIMTTLNISTKYFNQLIAIKSKNAFGPHANSCEINFRWTDTITGNLWGSFNINFEYYNVLFNIASLYFYLGYLKSISPKINKELRKEAIKDYKYSFYLFNIIRDEAHKKIEQRDLPYDLYPSYCEYCINLCIVYGQIEIVKIAEETNPNEYALRGKLLMGISENYHKAYMLSNADPAKMGGNDVFRNYLLNRYFYYKSLVYKKMAEIQLKKFDSTGLGYGEALIYQQQSVIQLDECLKTINMCGNLVEVEKFNDYMANEKRLEAKMADLNHRIYHQFTPDPNTIKLETKILMVPLPIEKLYIKENEAKFRDDRLIYCEDLDLLTPSEMKPMLEKYKQQMNEFMEQYLSKYENDASIKKFINKFCLPEKLTVKPLDLNNPKSSEIPPELWEKISKIQQLGGSNYLSNTMKKILNKSNELIENLNTLLGDVMKEEKEDNYYRKKLGDEWVINPSNTLNMNYIQTIKNYLAKINQAREYDVNESNQINENMFNFEELNNAKKYMENKIIQLAQKNVEMTSEEKKLRDEIVKLYSLGDKSKNIIDPILKDIKSCTSVIPFFSEIAMNRMTEKSVFDITKENYLKQLEPLEFINNDIKTQMKVISDLIPFSENSLFPKGENNGVFQYLENLEKYADEFFEKIKTFKKGENYYIEFEKNVNNVSKTVRDWLEHRKEEKKMLLGTFKGKITKFNPNECENPFDNAPNNDCYINRDKREYYSPNPQNLNQNMNNFNQNPNYNQGQNYNKEPNINYNQNYNQNYEQNQKFNNQGQNYNQNQPYNQNLNYDNQNNQNINNNQGQYFNNNQNYPPNSNQYYNQNQYPNQNYNQNNNQNFDQNQNQNINHNYNQNQHYNQNQKYGNQEQNYNQKNYSPPKYNQKNYNQNNQNYNQNNYNQNNQNNYVQNNNDYKYGNNIHPNNNYYNNNNQNEENNECGYTSNTINLNGTSQGSIYNNNIQIPPSILTPPPGFNQNNDFDDHFNPNQPQNTNNTNQNSGNPFGQNFNGNIYNENTPYNKGY